MAERKKLNVVRAAMEIAPPVQIFKVAQPMPGVMPAGLATASRNVTMATDYAGAGAVALPYGYGGAFYGGTDGWLGYPYLAQLTQRAEYRRPAEILAKEMTREWIVLKSRNGDKAKSDKIAKLRDALEKFRVQKHFQTMIETEGYFGRAQLYIDMKGATDNPRELQKPLTIDHRKIGPGDLLGFRLVEPFWTYPGAYNADKPLRPDFYKPQVWYVMGDTVHHSRMLTLVARPVPDILKPAYSFGGLSLSQMSKPYVDNWLRTRQSVSDLVHAFSTMVLSTNMSAELEEGCDSGNLQNRAALFNLFRDNRGLFVLDKDTETLENVSTPLSGLAELQAQSQEHMASVVGVPLVILLGVTPSGLNASSDGEVRTFYAWVKAQQEAHCTPLLRPIIDIIQLSEFGEVDDDITFEWVPLWQMSEVDAATVRKSTIDGDVALIDAGVIDPVEERAKLAASEDMGFEGVDLSGPPPEPPMLEDDESGGGGESMSGEEDDDEGRVPNNAPKPPHISPSK